MPRLTIQDGKLLLRDGKPGTEASCCCGPACGCSSAGTSPAIPSDGSKGFVWLEFSSCIGSGAAGTVDAPEAATPCDYAGMAGAITGVTLTNGGSGYARLGRVQPTVTASVSGGSGATLSVTLAEQSENLGGWCMPAPYWEVDSVSVTAGGSGYSDGISVTFSVASGDTQITAAKAYAYVGFDEPANATVTVTSSGSGASLTPTWSTTTQPAPPIERGGSANPPNCEKPPRDAYTVAGFTINNGGSGYAVDDAVDISFALSSDGVIYPGEPGAFAVDTVDGNGAITAVRVDYGGVYGGAFTDAIAEVVVESCTANAGHYYCEDASEAPYVATVTVTVNQESPSTGSGASVTATVEDDTSSANFGKVVSLSLANGGSGYLQAPAACGDLDTLYITWGDNDAEPVIAARRGQNTGGQGLPFQVCQASEVCLEDGTVEELDADIGKTFSRSLASVQWPGVECKCGGKLHLTLFVAFYCFECRAGGRGQTPWNLARQNFGRDHYYCLRFEMDEDGCPVGDAEVISFTKIPEGHPFLRSATSGQNSIPENTPCYGYDPDDYPGWDGVTFDENSPCPCDVGCDIRIDPVVSFLP